MFWLYFAPFAFISVSIIVLDLMTSGFYLVDYFSTLNINGLMRLMEISNTEEVRPILEQVSITTRSSPAIIMFAATSKCVVLLVLSFFVVLSFVPAVWQICVENEDIVNTINKVNGEQEPVAAVPPRALDINVTVTHTEPTIEVTQIQPVIGTQGRPRKPQAPLAPHHSPQSTMPPQLPYNPMYNSKKDETEL